MKDTFDQIQSELSQKGKQLDMEAYRVTYESQTDPGMPAEGYTTGGISETINIPDEYMSKAGAGNSTEFLNWLKSQS